MGIIKQTLLLLTILFATTAYGAESVITAPDKVAKGNMVTLTSTGSTADFKTWIIDPRLEKQIARCQDQIFTVINVPGTYTFTLVTADATGIDIKTHLLEVEGPVTPDPPPIPPPLSPGKIQELSSQKLLLLDSPVTKKNLLVALKQITPKSTLDATKDSVRESIEGVFLQRPLAERTIDWKGIWREPINAAISKLNITTTAEYMAVVKELVKSLETTAVQTLSRPPPSPPVVVLEIDIQDNCAYCIAFDNHDIFNLPTDWVIQKYSNRAVSGYPTFTLRKGNRSKRFVGYRTYQQLMSEANSL